MSRRVNFQLNEEQLAEIEQVINHAVQPEVRQRAIVIRLLQMLLANRKLSGSQSSKS